MMTPINRRGCLYALLVFCAVLAVFAQVRHFDFLSFDDPSYVYENPTVTAGLSWQGVRWAFVDTATGHWHPLTWLSLMLDCEIFGINPAAMHLENLVIHALSSVLLFFILWRSTGAMTLALVAALIFGVHPLRIESVVWITERKDVLSVLFGLIALAAYLTYVRRGGVGAYLGVVAAFSASLLSKPTFVTLPALLLCFDIFPLRRLRIPLDLRNVRSLIIEKLPLCAVSIGFCAIAILGQHAGGGLQTTSAYPLAARFESVAVAYLAYLGKFFFPAGFGIFYPFEYYPPGVPAGALCALIVFSCISFGARKQYPYVWAGWLWFLVSLVPMIGFVQIGGQAFADRWTYLPHIGILIASVWWVAEHWSERRVLRMGLASIVPVVLATITVMELPHWRDSRAVYEQTLRVSPGNFMAHTNLTSYFLNRNDLVNAGTHGEEAVRLNPTYPEALNNFGIVRARQGNFVEASRLFSQAVAIRGSFTVARYNYGLALSNMGRPVAGVREWIEVLIQNPRYEQARTSARSLIPMLSAASCEELRAREGGAAFASLQEVVSRWHPGPSDQDLRGVLTRVASCS